MRGTWSESRARGLSAQPVGVAAAFLRRFFSAYPPGSPGCAGYRRRPTVWPEGGSERVGLAETRIHCRQHCSVSPTCVDHLRPVSRISALGPAAVGGLRNNASSFKASAGAFEELPCASLSAAGGCLGAGACRDAVALGAYRLSSDS